MKKFICLFVYLFIIQLFLSCEKDLYEDKIQEKERIRRVDLSELPFLKSSIERRLSERTAEGKEEDELSYYLNKINSENVIEITDSTGLKNYTFALKLEVQDTLINFCAKETDDGYRYYLIKYSSENLDEWISDKKINQESLITPDVSAEYFENNKIRYYVDPCVIVAYLCPSFMHDGTNGSCIYHQNLWTVTYDFSNCGGGGDSGGGGGSGAPTVPPIVTVPNLEDVEGGISNTPCAELKKHLSTTTGIKLKSPQIYNYLSDKLNQPREFGFYFKKENDIYTPYESINGTSNKITIKVGENYFCSIHIHPYPSTNPMFSWEDVFSLQQYFQLVDPILEQEVTIFLICKDINGTNQLYALKIDDYELFSQSLTSQIQSVVTNEDVANATTDEERNIIVKNKMNNDIHEYCLSNQNVNQEIPFLNYFANSGISLYKANDNLTNWDKLILSNNSTNPITKVPCL